MLTGRVLARCAGAVLVGALVGLVGTGIHRSAQPFGLGIALLIVLVAAVLARAWAGWLGMLSLGLGLVTVIGLLSLRGPGGDVLIAAQPIGYAWYASALVIGLAGLAPAGWFSERPVGGALE